MKRAAKWLRQGLGSNYDMRAGRRAIAKREYERRARERVEAGLPEVPWYKDPPSLMMLVLCPSLILVSLLVQLAVKRPEVAIVFGLVIVVILGSAGLILRGVGELKKSPELKAYGYFLGATAYVATASMALTNGLRLVG